MGNRAKKDQLVYAIENNYFFVGRVERWEGNTLLMQLADQENTAANMIAAKFGGMIPDGLYDWLETEIPLKLTFKQSDRSYKWRQIQIK